MVFVVVVVGGLGSLGGAMLASLLIGVITSLAVGIDRSLAVGLLRHVAVHEDAADLVGDLCPSRILNIGHDHTPTLGGQCAGRALAESRRAAGDDKDVA